MENTTLNWIANFIWGIADDVLRDLYVRGKYRDVILPMTVLRRLDAVLEPTKQAVLQMKATLDKAGIVQQDAALRQAAGQAFYNTSPFTLRDLRNRANQQQLRADFEVPVVDSGARSVADFQRLAQLGATETALTPVPAGRQLHALHSRHTGEEVCATFCWPA